jgi:hypothetical protein
MSPEKGDHTVKYFLTALFIVAALIGYFEWKEYQREYQEEIDAMSREISIERCVESGRGSRAYCESLYSD